MNTSAIFEYAYRNPESDIAQELFSIQENVDYNLDDYNNFSNDYYDEDDYNFGYPTMQGGDMRNSVQFIVEDTKKDLASLGAWFKKAYQNIKGYPDRLSNDIDTMLKSQVRNGETKLKAIQDAIRKLEAEKATALGTGAGAQVGSQRAIAARFDKDIERLKTSAHKWEDALKKLKDRESDFRSRAEINQEQLNKEIAVHTGGTKWYGKHVGSHIKSASKKLSESKLGKKFGGKDLLHDVSADTAGKGALIGAGVAAGVGTGAAIGRHVYLKHRMKQTGAKSKADVKKIIRERAATKALMRAKGANKVAIKTALKKQYGY